MVGIFKANNPLNTFLLFIYGLLLKLAFLTNGGIPAIKKSDGIAFVELMKGLKTAETALPFIYPLITFLLLFIQAITFNRLVNDQRLLQRSTHLPAMSYLLITSLFAEWNTLTPALVINTFLIWLLRKMNNLYTSQNPKATVFNIGLVIGISAFFYFPTLVFIVLLLFALLMNRPFNLAEWVISLLGIITPFYLLFVFLFLTGRLHYYEPPNFAIGYPVLHDNYWPLAAIALVITAFFSGAYFIRANLTGQVLQVRKSWSLILICLIVTILSTFINDTHTFEYWLVTAIPLSAFTAAAFFYAPGKWLPILLHWSMVAFVIASSYFLH